MRRFIVRNKLDRNFDLYLMLLPVLAYYIVFHYMPMYGVQIAFKNFQAFRGISKSPWLDDIFANFKRFFDSPYFVRLITNTLRINVFGLLFGFPLPIILALMINELRNKKFQRFAQTVTYAPYFLSVIVIVGLIRSFVNPNHGIINKVVVALGGEPKNWMQIPEAFLPIYILSDIWQSTGWNAIIYISALAGVPQELHEAARIDGANRFQRIIHINLPSIAPTIVILLILRFGSMMNVGFQKAFLLQNDLNLNVSDIISTYVYRIGIQGAQFAFSTAIELFNSLINFVLLIAVNQIAKRTSETSLW